MEDLLYLVEKEWQEAFLRFVRGEDLAVEEGS